VRVYISNPPLEAVRQLWSEWVALSVTAWTGKTGRRGLKLVPFLIPPFRILVMNENGDFFPATPFNVLHHLGRRFLNSILSAFRRLLDLALGASLWLFAVVAQHSAPLSRWLFRHAHGNVSLDITIPPPEGDGIDVVRYGRRHWRVEDVRSRVYHSPARWLLFLEGPAEEPDVASWVKLLDDPRAFAVSAQIDYQDWKPGLFPTAAFRRLQPGEASMTLAPVSTAMLVDRAKLAALGVARTAVPGTAWLQIFWLASAAGWRSYSVGGAATVGEAPDWPYEEAELVTRVLRDPALRMLGPREPDLARGNVAFEQQQPFRGLPRVLVVSPYLPFPLSHGGAVRIFNLCRALSDSVDFVLLAFREKNERVHYAELLQVFRHVYAVDLDERENADPSLPQQVRQQQSRGMRAWIAELCAELEIDLMQVEFTHLAHMRDAALVPAVLVEHDVTFTLYRQMAEQQQKKESWKEYDRWLEFEQHAFRQYNAVWTMSAPDRDTAIAHGSAAEQTFVIENGVDLERFQPLPPASSQEILYIGSFRHLPNILGFERLVHEIMPRVWKSRPDARLRVVAGPQPEKYWKKFRKSDMPHQFDSRIELHAFVADVRPHYATAAVVAVPLVISAGTNVKVMEAMACARAVVTTPVGCTGLGLNDGVDALIRDSSESFADAVIYLLDSAAQRLTIAANARRTVEQRFNWKAIARQALESYRRILNLQ
jgi:glycosyltransferase involved in cell wall biosynthesis